MDPRQPPQHPFSRNTASPYGRSPFPPSSNQPSFPASSHPPTTTPSYAEHQRRPSDPPPYYNPQRGFAQDGASMSGSTHSRHQSASSIGTPVNRGMPPPSSPQQQHSYGPPPPRAPPVSLGPPTAFPSGRELPSLNSLGRPPSTSGSSMSISSMLGGPPPAAREQPSSQYTSPVTTSAPPPMYPGPTQASPRSTTTNTDYAPFRRPQTPEHQRGYELRDHRANSAGSPTGLGTFGTPDTRRYGTPHTYGQRPADERRDQQSVRVTNTAIPPRPNSQPSFNAPPTRAPENPRAPTHNEGLFGARRVDPPRAEPIGRPEAAYQRQSEFEERQNAMYAYEQRARQEREAVLQREMRDREQREQRERERAINEHNSTLQQEYAHQLTQRNAQSAYNRPAEPRDQPSQPSWMRPGYEGPRPAYDPIPEQQRPPPVTNAHEYPVTTAPQYAAPPSYASNESRYQPSQSSSIPPQHSSVPASKYDGSIEQQLHIQHQLQQQRQQQRQQQQSMYGGPPQNGPYQSQESPTRRAIEDAQPMQQQRSFLGVQEINRKGRVSPLPQAVQGAQGQLGGPAGEPGIKSEFGRMFSGIGSGVGGAMGVPSPVTAGPQGMPFSNPGQMRRDEMDQDSPIENGRGILRTASRGGRRRKLKDEDSRGDDESSNGRNTPSGRGKRAKPHHHHHHNHHHHHHHRSDPPENTSPNQIPFKSSIKGTAIPSPPDPETKGTPILHHHHISRHHHHHVTPAKAAPQANPVIPLPKTTVRSQAVLDAVSHLPRRHLGYGYYSSKLHPARRAEKDDRGFASTPVPLPRFEGQENCTFTIKVPKVYMGDASRMEITSRKGLWGTDVYSDDSDVIAACIHQGWFRGAWSKDVDVDLLGLEIDGPSNGVDINGKDYENHIITDPPPRGPMHVLPKKGLHITVLVLPALEKYSSMTRFGIKSREWGGRHDGYRSVHDGLSFMIMSIQWVDGVDDTEGRSGASRRKIMAEELDDTELEAEQAWGNLLVNGNGTNGQEIHAKESFERGTVGDPMDIDGVEKGGDIKGVGMGSWWKRPSGVPKGKDKNADRETDIEKVTEKMIENANVHTKQDLATEEEKVVKRERISDKVTTAL